jgi:hypothetical protein
MYALRIAWCTILFNSGIEDLWIPPKLASGEKQHIVQGGIEGVCIRDALQRFAMVAIQDNVLRTLQLITITWQNHSYLLDCSIRGIIATPVTVRVKAKSNATLPLFRHGSGQLISLFVKANSRMGGVEHALKSAHGL